MKKKYNVIFAMVLALMCICTGCGNSASTEVAEGTTEAVIAADETEEAVNEDTEEETAEEETAEEETTQEETAQENNTVNETTGGSISEEWTDMQFEFDGKSYDIPFSYKELEAAGWTFDLSEYGYENGYILNPDDKISSTIHLENDAYDPHEVYVSIGFINNSDTAKDIMECDIWSFSLDVATGFSKAEAYPDMKIAKGIGLGSSREEVEAAFGKAEDVYEEKEEDYISFEYSIDYTYYLRFVLIGDEVTSIELQQY